MKFYKKKKESILAIFQKPEQMKEFDKISRIIEEGFIDYWKEILFSSKNPQKSKKRFYQILIRDMMIIDLLQENFKPFLIEITEVAMKIQDYQEFFEVLEANTSFFNEIETEMMRPVNDRLKIFKNSVFEICINYFD